MWLVGNHGVMTNQERFSRHIGDTEVYQVCRGDIESILHIIWDFPAMTMIWKQIIPRGKQQAFFTMSLFEWIFVNLGEGSDAVSGSWSTMFVVAVWWA